MRTDPAIGGNVLVIVYSRTGTGWRLAQLLGALHDWPVATIRDARPHERDGGAWRRLLDTWLLRRPAIVYDGPEPQGYDAVVLVSPTRLARLAAPMRSFIASRRGQLREVAFLSVCGACSPAPAAAEVTRLLGRTPLVSVALRHAEVEDGRFAEPLQAFGRAVARAAEALQGPLRKGRAALARAPATRAA